MKFSPVSHLSKSVPVLAKVPLQRNLTGCVPKLSLLRGFFLKK
jgi:hypothetical protein